MARLLVGELLMKDPDLAALWAEGRVGECISGTEHFRHPVAGEFKATFNHWAQASHPEHRIEIYDPEDPGRVLPALRTVPDAGLGADQAVRPGRRPM